MLRRVLALLLILALPTTAVAARLSSTVFDAPRALPAFALEDHSGKPYGPERLKGHWTLILIGYTNCPDVCPFTLSNLEALIAELSQTMMPDKLPRVVFLAADPKRDTLLLADYVAHFHPDFVGVTGALDQIDLLVKGLDGFVRRDKPDADGNYRVSHSAAVSIVGPDGTLRGRIMPPFPPAETAAFLANLMRARTVGDAR